MKHQPIPQELKRLETKRRSLLITSILQPIFMVLVIYYFIGFDAAQNFSLIIAIAIFLVALNLLQLLYYHMKYLKLKKSITDTPIDRKRM